jgi:hypothetical protein
MIRDEMRWQGMMIVNFRNQVSTYSPCCVSLHFRDGINFIDLLLFVTKDNSTDVMGAEANKVALNGEFSPDVCKFLLYYNTFCKIF